MADDVRRDYSAMKVTNFHRRMKLKSIEYKGGKCINCGYKKSAAALVFHHRNPEEKDFTISRKVLKWGRLQPELDKCDLLCSNCHLEEHERLQTLKETDRNRKVREVIPERRSAEVLEVTCLVCKILFKRKDRLDSTPIFCSNLCRGVNQEKTHWPDREQLQEMVLTYPVTVIAKQLGVSDVAVKKRCKKLRITTYGRGYWTKYTQR